MNACPQTVRWSSEEATDGASRRTPGRDVVAVPTPSDVTGDGVDPVAVATPTTGDGDE